MEAEIMPKKKKKEKKKQTTTTTTTKANNKTNRNIAKQPKQTKPKHKK